MKELREGTESILDYSIVREKHRVHIQGDSGFGKFWQDLVWKALAWEQLCLEEAMRSRETVTIVLYHCCIKGDFKIQQFHININHLFCLNCKVSRTQQEGLSLNHIVSSYSSTEAVGNPSPTQLIHMVELGVSSNLGLVLSMWAFSQRCLGFLKAWRLGSKNECSKRQEIEVSVFVSRPSETGTATHATVAYQLNHHQAYSGTSGKDADSSSSERCVK